VYKAVYVAIVATLYENTLKYICGAIDSRVQIWYYVFIGYGGYMKTWIANKEALYFNIQNKVYKMHTGRMNYLLGHMTKEDMMTDIWIDVTGTDYKECIECMSMYDGRSVTEWEVGRMIRKRASVCVEYWVHRVYKKTKTKMRRESDEMKKRYHDTISWDVLTRRSLKDVLSTIDLDADENTILLWKMDLMDDVQAMFALECSERTLYNRWDKLKAKIIGGMTL
jgi:hypothetical protein